MMGIEVPETRWAYHNCIKYSVTSTWSFFSTHMQRCTDKHNVMIIIYTVRDHTWWTGRVFNQTLQIDIKIFVTPEFLRLTCNILDTKRDRHTKRDNNWMKPYCFPWLLRLTILTREKLNQMKWGLFWRDNTVHMSVDRCHPRLHGCQNKTLRSDL